MLSSSFNNICFDFVEVIYDVFRGFVHIILNIKKIVRQKCCVMLWEQNVWLLSDELGFF